MQYKFLTNKKGEERILTFWWLFILTMATVFIVAGVWLFYSYSTDVKGIEAEILSTKIISCLTEVGYLRYEVIELNKEIIFKDCRLNEKIINSGKYYVKISYSFLDSEEGGGSFYIGNNEFDIICEERFKGENYPKCSEKEIDVLYEPNGGIRTIKLNVLSASNNLGASL